MFRHTSTRPLRVVATSACIAIFGSLVTAAVAQDEAITTKHNDLGSGQPTGARTTPEAAHSATKPIDEATQKIRAEALKRRAGENARGEALVLGMSLQERPAGHVRVVEVAPATPASDAGLREGDEIIAYQGFSADSYRKWIDGVRRLTADSPAGSPLLVVVVRDGKRMPLTIRIPERPRIATNKPLGQQLNPITPGAVEQQPVAVPTGPAGVPVGGGTDIAIDNTGPFGEFFAGSPANDRAMAHIARLGTQTTTGATNAGATRDGTSKTTGAAPPAAAAPGAAPNAPPTAVGMRIGLAGFRDTPAGMVVMVDVGALSPGNYSVGIVDPSLVSGINGPGSVSTVPNVGTPSQPVAPQGQRPGQGELFAPRSGAQPTPSGPSSAPSVTSAGPGLGTSAGAGEAAAPATTAPGQVSPATATPNDAANPTNIAVAGQRPINNVQPPAPTVTAATNNATLNQISTITVDQSGTGRMQQTVEGVQVRGVVGQAIVLYSQGAPQNTLPADLNGAAGPGSRAGVHDTALSRSSQGTGNQNEGKNAGGTPGTRLPVAGGIIRLISDRRPTETGTANGAAPAVEQPASAVPAAGQNPIR
jgi:membrane-associated protease RseP (regulator of RpoE activity)